GSTSSPNAMPRGTAGSLASSQRGCTTLATHSAQTPSGTAGRVLGPLHLTGSTHTRAPVSVWPTTGAATTAQQVAACLDGCAPWIVRHTSLRVCDALRPVSKALVRAF